MGELAPIEEEFDELLSAEIKELALLPCLGVRESASRGFGLPGNDPQEDATRSLAPFVTWSLSFQLVSKN